MHQFGWLSERGGGGGCNFLNLLQKEGIPQKRGIPTLEETMKEGSLSPEERENIDDQRLI